MCHFCAFQSKGERGRTEVPSASGSQQEAWQWPTALPDRRARLLVLITTSFSESESGLFLFTSF